MFKTLTLPRIYWDGQLSIRLYICQSVIQKVHLDMLGRATIYPSIYMSVSHPESSSGYVGTGNYLSVYIYVSQSSRKFIWICWDGQLSIRLYICQSVIQKVHLDMLGRATIYPSIYMSVSHPESPESSSGYVGTGNYLSVYIYVSQSSRKFIWICWDGQLSIRLYICQSVIQKVHLDML